MKYGIRMKGALDGDPLLLDYYEYQSIARDLLFQPLVSLISH
jgi:hypothetical protein